jgi:hypothetical protein
MDNKENINQLKKIINFHIKEFDSPLVLYNQIILKIADKLNKIYYPNNDDNQIILKNKLIFEDTSIKLFGFIILHSNDNNDNNNYQEPNKSIVRFIGDISSDRFNIIRITIDNYNLLSDILWEYLYLRNNLFDKYDESITQNMIDIIFKSIVNIKNELSFTKAFLIPYNNKLSFDNSSKFWNKYNFQLSFNKIDIENNTKQLINKSIQRINLLENLSIIYNQYIVDKIYDNKDNIVYQYFVKKCVSQELDESKSINNLRLLENDTIKTGLIVESDLYDFISKLYFFGIFSDEVKS